MRRSRVAEERLTNRRHAVPVTLTLRSRLTLVYAAVFGLLLTAIGVVSYGVLAYELDRDVTTNLLGLTSGLHGYLHFDGGEPVIAFNARDPVETAFIEEATRYYQVFDAATGRLLVQSEAMRPLALEFTPEEVSTFREQLVMRDIDTDYGRIRLSNSVITPDGGGVYLLQVGVSLASLDRVLDRFLVMLFFVVPAGLFASVLAGRWMARVALRPLAQVAHVARTIDIAALQQRLPIRGAHDELDELTTAFNETLGRLEQAVGEMRQFSTALAHELRTPLSALRGEIELALREAHGSEAATRQLASQLEEIDRLKRLIDQILMLARAEAGDIPLTSARVDLSALVAAVVDQIELVASAKGIELQYDRAAGVYVAGDEPWLTRMLLNLLDNAIKFTTAGGQIRVAVSQDDDVGRLTVHDSGSGIPPDAIPHVFDRFFRADPARPSAVEGVGLGLSLVKWIVDQHHGQIDVSSELGRGSTFTVRLPVFH
jgi:heavy metal sensor kinase